MAIFPDIKPLVPHESGPIDNVKRNVSESGKAQSRDVWGGVEQFHAAPEWNASAADARTLLAFYRANRDVAFTYYDFEGERSYTAEAIGTGDGVTTTFVIPAKETKDRTVYVAGVAKTAGVHYNVTSGSGSLGEDRVVFTAGNEPAAAAAITITYTGRHRYSCEFLERPSETTISTTGRKAIRMRIAEAF